MAKYYGYCYNEEGRFTEMIPLESKYDRYGTEVGVDIPPQCTLQRVPDGQYYPIFVGDQWVITRDLLNPNLDYIKLSPIEKAIKELLIEIETLKLQLPSKELPNLLPEEEITNESI